VCDHITKDEIKETLKKMANGKAEGLDQISVEVWKCLDEVGRIRVANGVFQCHF